MGTGQAPVPIDALLLDVQIRIVAHVMTDQLLPRSQLHLAQLAVRTETAVPKHVIITGMASVIAMAFAMHPRCLVRIQELLRLDIADIDNGIHILEQVCHKILRFVFFHLHADHRPSCLHVLL